jgi:hypothetical protein
MDPRGVLAGEVDDPADVELIEHPVLRHQTTISTRTDTLGSPTTDMSRYPVERAAIVRAAWELLRERADLLPTGEAIMTEIGEILGQVG